MLRAIIADDEDKIVQLIKVLVNWDELGIEVAATASNGLEAIELVNTQKPDILITDIRMPGCDGLKLIESVHESSPNLRIIIISGYAHFEYAQQAIKFGVGDYLLKPISKIELNNALKKISAQIIESQKADASSQDHHQNNQNDLINLRKRLISNLLDNADLHLTGQLLQDVYHMNIQPGIYQALCVKIDYQPEKTTHAARDVLFEKINTIFTDTLRSDCFEMISERRGSTVYGIINYKDGRQKIIRHLIRESLEQLDALKSLFPGISFSAALGCAVNSEAEITRSFSEVSILIKERLLQGSGLLLESMPLVNEISWQKIIDDYVRQFSIAIEEMDQRKATEATESVRKLVLNRKNIAGFQVFDFVCAVASVISMRNDALLSDTILYDSLFSHETLTPTGKDKERFLEECDLCNSSDALFDLLGNKLKQIIKHREEAFTHNAQRPVRMAKQYIREHYADQITLEDVSSAVGLSSGYFSSLFKKETGEGFAKYLIHSRMEEAKRLLRETNLPVADVCRQVGYYDVKHFSGTFEKYAGIKPATFRKLYG